MFSFLRKKSLVTRAARRAALMGAVLVLLTGFLFVSCEQPGGISNGTNEKPGDISNGTNAQSPTISVQPQGGTWTATSKNTFDLTVTASSPDNGTLSYQWYSNTSASNSGGTAIDSSGTSATLSLAKANYTTDGSYYFYVVVTNTITDNGDGGTKTAAKTSNVATVTVTGNGGLLDSVNAQQPSITGQPSGGNWNVTSADTFDLTVTAVSPDSGTLSYQWYSNSDEVNSGGTPMSGETEATLSLAKDNHKGDGKIYFYVVVTNTITDNGDGGNKTAATASDAVAVVISGNGVDMVNAHHPNITGNPATINWDVSADTTKTLTVTANSSDGGTLSYQWYSNTSAANSGGTAINSGGTSDTLTLNKADYTENGTYYFYVTVTNTITDNGDGGNKTVTVTSNTAMVTVSGIVPEGIQIFTSDDMAKIGVAGTHPLNGTYVLMNDITLEDWKPIIGSDGDEPFSGIFYGNNKTITLKSFDNNFVGAYAYNNGTKYTNVFLGIFGAVKGASDSQKAEIKDLKINSSVNIASANQIADSGVGVGLLTGYAELAVIDNITLSGSFGYKYGGNNGSAYLGGIAGFIIGQGTAIKNCTSTMAMDINPGYGKAQIVPGNANAFSFVGGFVGFFKDGGAIQNCHNSGAVSAQSDVNASQVMTGGILGGSHYSFASDPHGYIEDCSSTGDITVSAMGMWPMAGGIAGLLAGGTQTVEDSTHIIRCFASGTILNNSTSNTNWPYLGGIVGYIYVGAKVSQCCFTGTVINEKGNDYTGGIAGYSSYATGYTNANNNPSVVEDCWSSGEVKGRNNAGGIVGQNQQNTLLKRSYSLMKVSVNNGANSSAAQWGIGGIAGSHSNTNTTLPEALNACVALNSAITTPKTYNAAGEIHRIAGRFQGSPIMTNCYALSGLVPVADDNSYTADKGTNRPDGADIPAQYLNGNKPTQAFYQDVLKWDFTNVWKMGSDGYPKLKWQK